MNSLAERIDEYVCWRPLPAWLALMNEVRELERDAQRWRTARRAMHSCMCACCSGNDRILAIDTQTDSLLYDEAEKAEMDGIIDEITAKADK